MTEFIRNDKENVIRNDKENVIHNDNNRVRVAWNDKHKRHTIYVCLLLFVYEPLY